MKTAILLPGFLDSKDYTHMVRIVEMLEGGGYSTIRLDPCDLWETGNVARYNVTNYLNDIKKTVEGVPRGEIVLIGHSLGGYLAILAGSAFERVTTVISLCSPDNLETLVAEKWEKTGVRISTRDLPNDKSKSRKFSLPYSFVSDAAKYSALEAIRNLNKPLMLFIALEDTSVLPETTEKLVEAAKTPYVVRQEGIGHNFRHSEEETAVVVDRIKKFLEL